MLRSSPTRSSLFLPSSKCVLICDVPHFEAHQPAPPSSSPPACESSFVTCHVLKLTNSSSSPPAFQSFFVICHPLQLLTLPLPLPPLPFYSPYFSLSTLYGP